MRRKNWSARVLLVVAALAAGPISCDRYILLEIDGRSEKRISFECGELQLQAVKRMCPGYAIVNRFKLREDATASISGVRVSIGGVSLPFSVYRKGEVLNKREIPIESDDVLSLLVDQEVSEHDSIVVVLSGYLRCNSGTLDTTSAVIVVKPVKGRLKH